MRIHLGFLRRRSTEASLSTRPQPEEAQKWTESFAVLMASKCKIYSLNSCILHSCMRINLWWQTEFILPRRWKRQLLIIIRFLFFYRWIVTLSSFFTSRIQQRESGILAGRRRLQEHQTSKDGSQSAADLQWLCGRPSIQRSTFA